MSLVDGNPLFATFGPTLRTLDIVVRRPRVFRGWAVTDSDDKVTSSLPYESITGEARIAKDQITVIGSDNQPQRIFQFRLTSFTSTEDVKTEWQTLVANHGGDPLEGLAKAAMTDDEHRRLQYLRNCYREFEKSPPTAHVGFSNKDWEIGVEDHWFLECKIPRQAFEAIAADIRNGHCRRINIGIELAPTLVNSEYAPPSVPVIFGVFSLGEYDGGTGTGWTKYVSWRVVAKAGRSARKTGSHRKQSAEYEESEEAKPALPALVSESFATLSSQTAALAQTTRRGFTFAVVLLILFALLALR